MYTYCVSPRDIAAILSRCKDGTVTQTGSPCVGSIKEALNDLDKINKSHVPEDSRTRDGVRFEGRKAGW